MKTVIQCRNSMSVPGMPADFWPNIHMSKDRGEDNPESEEI